MKTLIFITLLLLSFGCKQDLIEKKETHSSWATVFGNIEVNRAYSAFVKKFGEDNTIELRDVDTHLTFFFVDTNTYYLDRDINGIKKTGEFTVRVNVPDATVVMDGLDIFKFIKINNRYCLQGQSEEALRMCMSEEQFFDAINN